MLQPQNAWRMHVCYLHIGIRMVRFVLTLQVIWYVRPRPIPHKLMLIANHHHLVLEWIVVILEHAPMAFVSATMEQQAVLDPKNVVLS